MPKAIDGVEFLSAGEVAETVGVHRLTLLRWIREGKIQDVPRDRNGWRIFSLEAVADIKAYAFSLGGPVSRYQPTLFSRSTALKSELVLVARAGKVAAASKEP